MSDLRTPAWAAAPPLPEPGQGRACLGCGLFLGAESFRPNKRGKNGLHHRCHDCERIQDKQRKTRKLSDPEERAAHTLVQRARKGTLAWPIYRQLRAEKRCAEFLREHPHAGGRGIYGYVYVLRDSAGFVLYVGQAVNVDQRLYLGASSHRFTKDWWPEVATVEVQTYRRADYDEGERWQIKLLTPLHNKARPKPRREEPPEPLKVETGPVKYA